jgi:hypothetical protein
MLHDQGLADEMVQETFVKFCQQARNYDANRGPVRGGDDASERDIELAHPDAFDFVFGNLRSGNAVWFNLHLDGCPSCQKVVDEYSEIGRIFQNLPPHA